MLQHAPDAMHVSLTPRGCYCAAQPGKCNVIMNCVEKGRLHLSGGSYIQGNEGVPPSKCTTSTRCRSAQLRTKRPLPLAPLHCLCAEAVCSAHVTLLPPAAGSLEFNAGVRNALGRAERLDVAAEWGSKGSNEYSVALSQPRVGGRPITVEGRIAQLFRNFTRHSSFTEQLRQAAVTVSTCAFSRLLGVWEG